MGDIAEDQARFIAVLQQGPSAFPDGLFTDEPDRALLGLKAHANTISHARLVALEDSYPRTRALMGDAAFNTASRRFIERPEVRTRKLMQLGQGFAQFLADEAVGTAACDLAQIEWAWLQAYHSAEARPLQLTDLAGLDEVCLLDLQLAAHPAMRLVTVQGPISALLPELAEWAEEAMRHVLITRPEAEVLLHPLSALQADLAAMVAQPTSFRNLLGAAIESAGEADALSAIFALIGAGMLTKPEG